MSSTCLSKNCKFRKMMIFYPGCTLTLWYITLDLSSKELQVPFLIFLFIIIIIIFCNVVCGLKGLCYEDIAVFDFLSHKHKMLVVMNQISNKFHQGALCTNHNYFVVIFCIFSVRSENYNRKLFQWRNMSLNVKLGHNSRNLIDTKTHI